MKIHKAIVSILAIVLLAGCSDARGLQNVRKKYPDSEIVVIPDNNYNFIIRKPDCSVWYSYSTGSSDATIDDVELIRAPVKGETE